MVSSTTGNLVAAKDRQALYQHPVIHPDELQFGPSIEEKRQAPRYKIAIPALLEMKDGDVVRITVTSISLAGFACDVGQFWEVGTRCWLKLPAMPQMPHFSMMEASVARCSGDVMGCAFSFMLHPDELDPYIAEYHVPA